MKLIIAVIQLDDAPILTDALVEGGFRVTQINTAGGFLRRGNSTILLGVDADRVDDALEVIRSNCQTRLQFINPVTAGFEIGELATLVPVEVQVGGATIWVVDVDEYVRL